MLNPHQLPDNVITTQLKKVVNWARRSSLWPMPFATACCGIELMATASSRYDLARFGAEAMRFSPRQSDLMIVAGRVTIKMMPVLQHIYQQMTEPKWVISMGACASTGGVFDAYATIQGIDQFMPVDVYVPGCPPRPETLIEGIMAIQRIIDEDGLPPEGRRRPLQLAVEPSYNPAAQPVRVPLHVGGRPVELPHHHMALLQQPIQRKLSALLGAQVTFDKLNLSLLSGTIEALGVTVAGEDRATPVLTIARVRASVAVARALKGEIVVKSLTIERPVINVVRANGKTNLPKRIKSDEPAAEPAQSAPDVVADDKHTWKLDAEQVLIVDGEANLQLDDYRVAAKPILAELKRSGDGYAVTLLVDSIAVAGATGTPLSLRASGTISNAADLTAVPKSPAKLNIEIADLAKLTLTTPAVASRNLQVSFEGGFTLARILALLPPRT